MPTPPLFIAVDDQPSMILVKDAQGHDQRIDNFARWKARGSIHSTAARRTSR
jgi:hypothetical protein